MPEITATDILAIALLGSIIILMYIVQHSKFTELDEDLFPDDIKDYLKDKEERKFIENKRNKQYYMIPAYVEKIIYVGNHTYRLKIVYYDFACGKLKSIQSGIANNNLIHDHKIDEEMKFHARAYINAKGKFVFDTNELERKTIWPNGSLE